MSHEQRIPFSSEMLTIERRKICKFQKSQIPSKYRNLGNNDPKSFISSGLGQLTPNDFSLAS
jgi:hypothetical protein